MGKEIISVRQFTIIVMLYSVGAAILIVPASLTQVVKQDAWVAAVLGVLVGLLLAKFYITVGNISPKLSLVQLIEKVLGKYVGKIIVILFLIFTYLSGTGLLYFLGDFMRTEVMPETPIVAFGGLFMIVIMFGTYLGIETFARSSEILFPIFFLLFIFLVVFISPQVDIKHLEPVLNSNPKPLINGILIFISEFAFPLVVLLMIFPVAINVPKSGTKGFYIGAIAGGGILIILITLCVLVLGPTDTAHRVFPSYAMAQRISIGNFIQRIEITMALLWIITLYVRIYFYFHVTVVGTAQLLKLKNYRSLILPLGLSMVALSQTIHTDVVHQLKFNKEIWIPYSATFALLLPLLLLIVAKIRKIKSE
ncbi:endospore germination permease [Viridibacillus sp. FSL R5-0477]|uniref:Variant surface antigen E (VlpE prolipoprotein) n=1 Tax=Viridibacillus arenosi FSL R5-213 TaxID=1227360 RepID=W4F1E1_9BACL|nr:MULTISPECIES: endospore germination permease [Viridibacillus]ETT86279.1 variant surface antigen E (VlpE prolipoprotein) [Viridibacillus arenosi FSL R5-213]OMC84820.1 hypothetical protein BK130_04200 [Viridibacillus sp. FSL H8-0123]OMC85836.1 hypothetical protein BK128_14535 [Viridibacillus sp. FSL H7-0596]OMC91868.1 hypothetical protein BK137_08140 [Viridibacillus arenosi]